jgi:hypothetical protein
VSSSGVFLVVSGVDAAFFALVAVVVVPSIWTCHAVWVGSLLSPTCTMFCMSVCVCVCMCVCVCVSQSPVDRPSMPAVFGAMHDGVAALTSRPCRHEVPLYAPLRRALSADEPVYDAFG